MSVLSQWPIRESLNIYLWGSWILLSQEVSSTIFWVFGLNRPGIEPRCPGPFVNTLTIMPISDIMSLLEILGAMSLLEILGTMSLLGINKSHNCLKIIRIRSEWLKVYYVQTNDDYYVIIVTWNYINGWIISIRLEYLKSCNYAQTNDYRQIKCNFKKNA